MYKRDKRDIKRSRLELLSVPAKEQGKVYDPEQSTYRYFSIWRLILASYFFYVVYSFWSWNLLKVWINVYDGVTEGFTGGNIRDMLYEFLFKAIVIIYTFMYEDADWCNDIFLGGFRINGMDAYCQCWESSLYKFIL